MKNTKKNYNNSYTTALKIYFSGEAIDSTIGHAIATEATYMFGFVDTSHNENFFYVPLWKFYSIALDKAKNRYLSSRNKFCSFIASNIYGGFRNTLVKELSKYKPVDHRGKFYKQPELFVEDKLAFNEDYKFTVCAENHFCKTYCSEKLLEAYASGCIPIYFGDPSPEFNKKAFIYGSTVEEIVSKVIEVDTDDNLYASMLSEPLFTGDADLSLLNLKQWFIDVLKKEGLLQDDR